MGKKINMSAQFNRDLKTLSKENKQEFLELVTELLQWPDMPDSRNKERLRILPDGPVYSMRCPTSINFNMISRVFPT
ncbi:MAG: hypothetical protein AB9903_14205 [Vulcanimicrobiota bacterium]